MYEYEASYTMNQEGGARSSGRTRCHKWNKTENYNTCKQSMQPSIQSSVQPRGIVVGVVEVGVEVDEVTAVKTTLDVEQPTMEATLDVMQSVVEATIMTNTEEMETAAEGAEKDILSKAKGKDGRDGKAKETHNFRWQS